jgi:hypothetical protein
MSWNQIWLDPPVDYCHCGYTLKEKTNKQTNKQKQNKTKLASNG